MLEYNRPSLRKRARARDTDVRRATREFQKSLQVDPRRRVKKTGEEIEPLIMAG